MLLYSEGWTTEQIGKALLIDRSSISRQVQDYKQSGKLKPGNGGSIGRLTKRQRSELISHLENHLYQHNYQIVAYVEKRWGIKFSVSGMHKWLHRHGFVYKQPKGVPYKANKKEQERFIEKYGQLKAESGEEEPIVFMDAVHPAQATKITHGWIKRGTNKVVATSAGRTRLNIVGAIQLGDLKNAIVNRFDCNINAEVIAAFLRQIREQYSTATTIHLIMDQAGYHKSEIVQSKAEQLDIKIHYLPPHSPNLNPIERLWKVMNKHAGNNQFFESAQVFRESIEHFFKETLPDIASSLDSTINDNFQDLECAS